MSLNDYRDEAGEFIKRLGESGTSDLKSMVLMLEEELNILKDNLEDDARSRHQLYDMLFLIFEIAAIKGYDLEEEWSIGKRRKEEKYLAKCIK